MASRCRVTSAGSRNGVDSTESTEENERAGENLVKSHIYTERARRRMVFQPRSVGSL